MSEDKKEKKSRFLKEIINSLSNKTSYFKNKTGWNNLWMLSDKAFEVLIEDLINIKKDINKKNKFLKEPLKYITDDVKTDFSVTYKEDKYVIGIPENNIERILTCINENNTDKIVNQLPTCDGGHIDLMYTKGDEISIVELKQWNGGDNPLFAIVELMKNYFLLLNTKQNENIKNKYLNKHTINRINLIILAPKEYYIKYLKGCDNMVLISYFKILDKLNTRLKEEIKDFDVKIFLKYINIKRETYEQKVIDKIKEQNELKIKNFDWKDFIDIKNSDTQNLLIEKWIPIETAQEWLRIANTSKSDVSL